MSYQLLSETNPKARKPYVCIWCGEEISKGEQHVKTDGVFDGDFQSSRFHSECHVAMEKELKESREEEFPPYEFKRGTTDPK